MLVARRAPSGRLDARVSAPRAWSVVSGPLVAGSIIAVCSCSSSASSRRSSSSHPWLVVCTLRGPRLLQALRTPSTPVTHVVYTRAWPVTTPIFQCVLGKLGTPASVRERMYATRAIDGTQSEQWGSYKATWTYEPDQGLTVIVSSR